MNQLNAELKQNSDLKYYTVLKRRAPRHPHPCCLPAANHVFTGMPPSNKSNSISLMFMKASFEGVFKALIQISSQISNNICLMLTPSDISSTDTRKDVTADVNSPFLLISGI